MNLRELNYILIPRSTERFDGWNRTPAGRFAEWLTTPLHGLTREGQVLVVATLISAAAGIDVRFSHLYLVFCGLFGLWVAAFVTRPFARVDGLALRIEHPRRTAAGEPITFTAVLHNRGTRPLYALRVYGPFLPWDGTWIARRPGVGHLAPGAEARVVLSARFLVRGERYIGRFSAASIRPLGLMRGRRVTSEPVRLTVVPPVVPVRAPAPPAVAAPPEGRARSRVGGESFELLGVRPYRVGDRIRDLHARSWARLGEPMVREYRTALRRRVRVALYGPMRRPEREAFDGAASLAASLVAWAAEGETRVELIIAAEPPGAVIVGHDASAFERALDLLAAAGPGPCADAEARAGAGLARGEPLYLVLADFAAPQAALLAALRARHPGLRPLLVTRDRAAAAAAERAGVRVWRPEALSSGVVLSSGVAL